MKTLSEIKDEIARKSCGNPLGWSALEYQTQALCLDEVCLLYASQFKRESKEFIICAAMKLESGKIYYGHRHPHCIEAANGELSWTMNREQISKVEKVQGFITNMNRFVDRKEATKIWLAENESNKLNYSTEELYSEDLY